MPMPRSDSNMAQVRGGSRLGQPRRRRGRLPECQHSPGKRVCFKIAGNKYRLIVKINYRSRTIFIRFIGTHAEYDRINANSI
jgi:mRNA interferase HigB